jgi:hypothetical protein
MALPTNVWLNLTVILCRLCLKHDGTRAETRFLLSPKRTSLFKSAGASVQSTAGSRGVCISGSTAGYTMFRGSVKSTGYPLHSPFSPSLPLPCVTVCHQVSNALYLLIVKITSAALKKHEKNLCCSLFHSLRG